MPTFLHRGLSLHYREAGHGRPVLLLHAFPLNGDSFEPQVRALSDRYRLIVPDLRGFGDSQGPSGPSDMATLAEDALALLDFLGVHSAVVGGCSMGGYASMAALRLDPGRIQALVLLDTQATADDEAGRARREELAQATLAEGMGPLLRLQVPSLLSKEAGPELKARVEAMARRTRPEGAAAALRGMALRPDSQELLARFSGPALIAVGEADPITPKAKAEKMASLIRGSKLVEVPRAGHLAHLEAPDAVNAALDGFLSSLPGSP